jgi:UDP-N-acetylmuramoyl-tripeptide--D-alanyl-D-alanine ligase
MKTFLQKCYQGILLWEASLFRSRYRGPVIAVAGSIGKTSVKDALALLVKHGYTRVIVTPKSLNAQLGIPLTFFGYKDTPSGFGWVLVPFRGLLTALWGQLPDCMVIEIGEEMPGDMAQLSAVVRPTIAIITSVSEAHSAYLGSEADVQKEILAITKFIAPDGVLIVNGDEPVLAKQQVRATQKKILVRQEDRADYFMSSIKLDLEGTEGILHRSNRTQKVKIARYGAHQLYSVLFTSAVGDVLDISPTEQQTVFKHIKPVKGRGMLIAGKKGSYILDESYNAQPGAMRAALETLAEMPAKKRVLILGDMRELRDPDPIHQEIGRLAHKVGDYIIGVGPLSKIYRPNEWFLTSQEAVASALRQLGPDVIVLVKGSQNTIRLERVVKALMQHPEQAGKLLVRQDPVWDKRP